MKDDQRVAQDRDNRILISTSSFGEFDSTPFELMREKGLSYILNPWGRRLKSSELIELGRNTIGMIAGTERIEDNTFSHLGGLKVISRVGAGMDNIDLESARRRGIKVYNTPDAPTLAVAELTIGLILNLLRKVNRMDAALRNGVWHKQMGRLLYGKRIGIIGFGRIGQKVGELLSPFGTELCFCDVGPKQCRLECTEKPFLEILSWADIITLHVSVSRGCGNIIGKKELSIMKKESYLVNVSRGGVVDEDALYSVLKNGELAGAAVDVFEREPYEGKLRELENVILTPHIGSYAREARIKMEVAATQNLLKGLGF